MTIKRVTTEENLSGVGYQLNHDTWIYESLADAITADAEEQCLEMFYSIECNECGAKITAVMNVGDIRIGRPFSFSWLENSIAEHNKTHLTRPQIIF